jgi:hypothetical protein
MEQLAREGSPVGPVAGYLAHLLLAALRVEVIESALAAGATVEQISRELGVLSRTLLSGSPSTDPESRRTR